MNETYRSSATIGNNTYSKNTHTHRIKSLIPTYIHRNILPNVGNIYKQFAVIENALSCLLISQLSLLDLVPRTILVLV